MAAKEELVRALFRPAAIALIGASGDPAKATARPQRFLEAHGYSGRIVPINPGRDEVLGVRAYPDIASAPGPIDHAFIMTPASQVPDIVAQCVSAGVKVATIYSDGFAERGEEGQSVQTRMVKTARAGGLRIVGPNSMGVIDLHAGAVMTVNAALEAREIVKGSIGVVSQSGTMLGALISRGNARGIGFSKLASIGNESDLGVAEVLAILVDDPDTNVIALFLETMRDPAALGVAARRAAAAGKPVIVYKLGRSNAGQAMALAHSGAIAGDDAAVSAFLRHHGMIRVNQFEALFELAPLVARYRPPGGKRVAVLTTTGGGAATVVDLLGARGIDLVTAPEPLRERLAPMGITLGTGPVIDVTMAGTRREVYLPAIEELLDSPACDLVVAVVGSSAQFHAEAAVEPIAASKTSQKPLVSFLVPQADASLRLLAESGIAAFRTPEGCAEAVAAFLDWHAPSEIPGKPPGNSLRSAEELLSRVRGKVMDEWSARAVFQALGVSVAPAQLVTEDMPSSEVGFPIAVKVVSPDIGHKTEAGGVALGIADDRELARVIAKMRARLGLSHPGARINGFMVQRMVEGLAEVLVGYRNTAEAGPIVTLAPGGTLAELYEDASIRVAPVDTATAHAMIDEVRGLAPVRGYRGMPKGDLSALAHAVVAVSNLATIEGSSRPVSEAEINPLIVREHGEGVVAVDALIVLEGE